MKGERAAIEAVGQFLITVEEALPQEVAGTSDVANKITEPSWSRRSQTWVAARLDPRP